MTTDNLAPAAPRVPASARGKRTRSRLVQAAKEVFERDGFAESRVADIIELSGISTGSFYTYFENKEAILEAVLNEAQEDMLHTSVFHDLDVNDDHVAAVEAGIRGYLEYYARNVKLMLLMEQVAGIDPVYREERRAREHANVAENAESVREWQAAGQADADIDALLVTRALSSMTIKFAYNCLALAENTNIDELVATLTRIWVRALGLKSGH